MPFVFAGVTELAKVQLADVLVENGRYAVCSVAQIRV